MWGVEDGAAVGANARAERLCLMLHMRRFEQETLDFPGLRFRQSITEFYTARVFIRGDYGFDVVL